MPLQVLFISSRNCPYHRTDISKTYLRVTDGTLETFGAVLVRGLPICNVLKSSGGVGWATCNLRTVQYGVGKSSALPFAYLRHISHRMNLKAYCCRQKLEQEDQLVYWHVLEK